MEENTKVQSQQFATPGKGGDMMAVVEEDWQIRRWMHDVVCLVSLAT
jgi:hypothetical protein